MNRQDSVEKVFPLLLLFFLPSPSSSSYSRNLNSCDTPFGRVPGLESTASNYEIIDDRGKRRRREKSRKQQRRRECRASRKNRMKYGKGGRSKLRTRFLARHFTLIRAPSGKYCRHQMQRSDILSSFCDSI